MFDEQAEATLESIDIVVDRVRRLGSTTIRSMGHISQLQTIEGDNNMRISAGDMVRILMKDNGHIASVMRNAITVCDKNRDSPTSSLP
ncbi:MAG TPA: ferritin-like domain-containing protein [Nitrososphaeraceae archaeon]|nr:ferritin-like domain-containing protein [Nitrososphaeraceae archaeon]